MTLSEIAKKINKLCSENEDWYDDDIFLIEDEDPTELARYGHKCGHIDESLMEDDDNDTFRI